MKKSFWCSFRPALVAGLLALLAPSVSWSNDTFSLHIQHRSPAVPTARVRITLETTGGATLATSTLSINGSSLFSFAAGFQALTSGDLFVFKQEGATNNVIIEIYPLSKLASPTNWCAYGAGLSGEQDFTLAFTGPTITAHRLTSYSVPSTVQCGCAVRRVTTNAAFWTDAPTGTNKGRHPLDIILVLDKSGSMNGATPGDAAAGTKWFVLQESVKQFISSWQIEGTGIGGTDLSKDRLGLIFFATAPVEVVTFGGNFFVERGTFAATDPGHPWNDIKAAIEARRPGGSTAMGDGLRAAIDQWTGITIKNDLTIVLMTNGMQNNGKLVGDDGTGLKTLFNTATGTVIPIKDHCIPIQTIGVGTAAAVEAELLDAISQQTAGTSRITATSAGMALGFADMLVEALKGNTRSLLSRTEATLNAASTASAPASFPLDGSVKQAIFVLGWRGGRNSRAIDLQIFAPGGTQPIPPVVRLDSDFHTVQRIDLPQSGPSGMWSVKVVRKPQGIVQDVPYHLSIYTVEGELEYRLSFSSPDHGTGKPIVLHAEVTYAGTPLTKLGSSIKARIESPSIAFGSIMHNTNVPDNVLKNPPPGSDPSDPTNPYERKLAHLLQTTDLLNRVMPKPALTPISLVDDGQAEHGDLKADDGVYSLKYDDTARPGLYRVTISLDINTPATGKISRIEKMEVEVTVNEPDPNKSEAFAQGGVIGGDYLINVIPADQFGNFLGPGHSELIDVVVSGGGSIKPPIIDERENGSYKVKLVAVPSGSDPIVTAKVRGKLIREAPLSDWLKPAKKYSLYLAAGQNSPRKDFNTSFDSGISFAAGFEYMFSNSFAGELSLGFDRFKGKSDLDLLRASVNLKLYLIRGTFQLPLYGGGGVYKFDPGDAHFGLNVGLAAEYRITTSFALEANSNFHNAYTSGNNTQFLTAQGGLRIRF